MSMGASPWRIRSQFVSSSFRCASGHATRRRRSSRHNSASFGTKKTQSPYSRRSISSVRSNACEN